MWYRRRLLAVLAALCSLVAPTPVAAQSGRNVLLVANESSPISVRIAEHYSRVRAVPKDQIVRLKLEDVDEITRDVYSRQIETPLAAWITSHNAHDRILYIVLAKGVPLRIQGSGGRQGDQSSVDSELTLLYKKLVGQHLPPGGHFANPFFTATRATPPVQYFTRDKQDIYLVTRLDGYTVDDVIALIDRGVSPARDGVFVLDQKAALLEKGNDWLQSAADTLTAPPLSKRVESDSSSRVITGVRNVLGYYSWGSNDPAIRVRRFDLQFVPGALAGMYVSTDGRTFKEPPKEWNIGPLENRSAYFGGSPQSLAGDFIRDGITGVAAHVAEPFLDATIRPDILFPNYVAGMNLAEAFYSAMPYLSWQTVVIGDPLCAPFRTTTLRDDQIDRGIDAATEFPAFFSARRLDLAASTNAGRSREALALTMRSEARVVKGDQAGARASLEQATALDDGLVRAHLALATMYEGAAEYDKAIDRYRRILRFTPNDPIALNNLAYALAVRKGALAEALPLADKAYLLSRSNPTIADTLGWIHYLTGDKVQAVRYLTEAARGLPKNAEVRLHAAVALAASGQLEAAARELTQAVAVDPTIENRDEARKLRAELAGKR